MIDVTKQIVAMVANKAVRQVDIDHFVVVVFPIGQEFRLEAFSSN